MSNKTRQLGCHSVAQLATCPLRDLILSSPSLAAAATALALLLPWPPSLLPNEATPFARTNQPPFRTKEQGNSTAAQQHETHGERSMSHQSQPGQVLDTNRKMYGRETEKAGCLPRLGRELDPAAFRRSVLPPPPAEPSAKKAARQLDLHQTLVSPSPPLPPFTEGGAQERQRVRRARKGADRRGDRPQP